jgi:hypothetical protein
MPMLVRSDELNEMSGCSIVYCGDSRDRLVV